MKYLFLLLFIILSIIHLYHSYIDDKKKRAYTKPFLLICLLLFYYFSVENRNTYLMLALLTSWLGDVLLIPKGHAWFAIGGISFFFTHVFFIIVYLNNITISNIPYLLVIPIVIVYYYIALKIMLAVKDNTPKIMLVPMFLYLVSNATMNAFALIQLFQHKNIASLIAHIGALLFFISDCKLFLVRYHTNQDLVYKKHFMVMLTYLLGELFITLGVMMLGG